MAIRRMHAWLGAGAGPVAVLAGLNMVDEFDRIAFSALSPEIRDAFGLSDAAILMLNVLPGLVILLTAGMIGWVTDRYSRIHVSMVAALAWAVASVLTGVVTSLLLLIVVRTISGLGRTANEIVHPSLIADLYPEKTHPRAYLVHRLGNPIAQASGVLAGWIATQWSWKWAFVVLALPTFVLLLLLSRLRDPGRRKAAKPTDGTATNVGKTSMVDAFRMLRTIRSMRRLWVAATMLGAASFGIFSLASLYFEHQFDLGKQGRGFVQFLIGAGWVTGVGIDGVLRRTLRASRVDLRSIISPHRYRRRRTRRESGAPPFLCGGRGPCPGQRNLAGAVLLIGGTYCSTRAQRASIRLGNHGVRHRWISHYSHCPRIRQ
jgi:MFS family permease